MKALTYPDRLHVQRALSDLLGRDVRVTDAAGLVAAPSNSVAVYRIDEGELVALLVGDVAFAARSGAALALTPAKLAEECEKAGRLNEALGENYFEVANVLSGLLNQPDCPHVVLRHVGAAADIAEADVVALIADGRYHCYTVDIDRYGKGAFAFVLR